MLKVTQACVENVQVREECREENENHSRSRHAEVATVKVLSKFPSVFFLSHMYFILVL